MRFGSPPLLLLVLAASGLLPQLEAGLLRWVPLPETPEEEGGEGSSILNPRSDASPSSACSAGEKEPKKGGFRQRRKPREPLAIEIFSNLMDFALPCKF